MTHKLKEIVESAHALGFKSVLEEDRAKVTVGQAEFIISKGDGENSSGFDGTPWHFHGELMLMTGESTFVQHGPMELLRALKRGEVLVCERHMRGKLQDRWLCHKDEPFSLNDMEPGEEIRVLSVQEERPRFQNSFESL